MDNKLWAAISYITLLGWLAAFFLGNEKSNDLYKFHLNQSLGLGLSSLAVAIVVKLSGLTYLNILNAVIFILAIIGIVNALGEKMNPLPIVGKWFLKNLKVFR